MSNAFPIALLYHTHFFPVSTRNLIYSKPTIFTATAYFGPGSLTETAGHFSGIVIATSSPCCFHAAVPPAPNTLTVAPGFIRKSRIVIEPPFGSPKITA
jgi:hypothetical protein